MKITGTLLAVCLFALNATAQSKPAERHYELQHIDVTNVDTTVSPCDNFYQYACGKYLAANPIPADQSYWGVAGVLSAWNRQVLRQILDTNAAPSAARTPNQQKIGDLYASCIAQPVNQFDAVRPLLQQIDAIHDRATLAAAVAAIHRSFGRTWESNDNQAPVALFGYGPNPDLNDVSHVVAGLDQGGLGMPGRDFYLSDSAEMKATREHYLTLISTLLKLSGTPASEAAKDASTILALETTMAKSHMNNIDRRDPNKINNRFTLAQVKTLAPSFDWDTYFTTLEAPAVPLYEVSAPDFFTTLDKLLTSQDLPAWKIYLRWQLLNSAASYLGKPWRDAAFEFQKSLTGQPEQQPDTQRCTRSVDRFLGEALGEVYVAQVFPPEAKARAQKMVKDIEAAMGRDINAVTWMQPSTKQQALLKLAAVVDKIGYPDKWIDYSSLAIVRSSYTLNVEHATAFELHRQLAFIGHPLDRTQWAMSPPTVDAYEDPQSNTINFPAGILQPVYFDTTEDDAINYGAEGSVVGHELTHDFDDQGRKFDVNGNLKDWWTAEDAKAYEERGACIATEYTGPVPGISGVTQNGKLTQGEDTADNGGLYLALSALTEDLKTQGKALSDKDPHGLTSLQRFFLAYANGWCETVRPEAARTLIVTNPHSIPQLRVNNVVSNMPEFAGAFSCKASQAMVHTPACRVW